MRAIGAQKIDIGDGGRCRCDCACHVPRRLWRRTHPAAETSATGRRHRDPPAGEGRGREGAKPVKKAKEKLSVAMDCLRPPARKRRIAARGRPVCPEPTARLPKASCVKVDKSAAKASKDSCPTMFEALCKETAGCAWTPGSPAAAEGAAATPGACSFAGKGKKAAAAEVKKPAAATTKKAEPVIPPDTFADQQ